MLNWSIFRDPFGAIPHMVPGLFIHPFTVLQSWVLMQLYLGPINKANLKKPNILINNKQTKSILN